MNELKPLNSYIDDEQIREIVAKIVEIAHPLTIILFGSYVHKEMNSDSDLDILVVVDDNIENTRKESVKIRRALRGILAPMDIVVVREFDYNKMKEISGLIYKEATQHGIIVYES